LLLSLILSQPEIMGPMYHWLLGTLPQQGSNINWFTATVLTFITCAAYVVGVSILGIYFGSAVVRSRIRRAKR